MPTFYFITLTHVINMERLQENFVKYIRVHIPPHPIIFIYTVNDIILLLLRGMSSKKNIILFTTLHLLSVLNLNNWNEERQNIFMVSSSLRGKAPTLIACNASNSFGSMREAENDDKQLNEENYLFLDVNDIREAADHIFQSIKAIKIIIIEFEVLVFQIYHLDRVIVFLMHAIIREVMLQFKFFTDGKQNLET